jgi:hypothetical protein
MGPSTREKSGNRSSQDDRGANGTRATKQPQPRRRPQGIQDEGLDEGPEQEPVEGPPEEPGENGPDEATDDVLDPQG